MLCNIVLELWYYKSTDIFGFLLAVPPTYPHYEDSASETIDIFGTII